MVDKLISKIGFDRVVAGISMMASPSSTNDTIADVAISQYHFSRPWLAVEILCTWKWVGGNVSHTFMSSFLGHVKNGGAALIDSVMNILLDGALVHGVSAGLNLLWRASLDELDAIEAPFLRALMSLLSAVQAENLWGSEKAISMFQLLLDKLFVGDIANSGCLTVLPCVMNVLIKPLCNGYDDCTNDQCDLYTQSELHHATLDCLKRAVSFPPLYSWHTGEGS